mgnify:FL=1
MCVRPLDGAILSVILCKFNCIKKLFSSHRKFGRCQFGIPEDEGREEINIRQNDEDMVALETKMGLKEISGTPKDPDKSQRSKFGIYGEELIEKEVKKSGNCGRVYLPPNWVGKQVKIIRID